MGERGGEGRWVDRKLNDLLQSYCFKENIVFCMKFVDQFSHYHMEGGGGAPLRKPTIKNKELMPTAQ